MTVLYRQRNISAIASASIELEIVARSLQTALLVVSTYTESHGMTYETLLY